MELPGLVSGHPYPRLLDESMFCRVPAVDFAGRPAASRQGTAGQRQDRLAPAPRGCPRDAVRWWLRAQRHKVVATYSEDGTLLYFTLVKERH